MGHTSTAGMSDLIYTQDFPAFPYTSPHIFADLRYPLHLSYDILGQAGFGFREAHGKAPAKSDICHLSLTEPTSEYKLLTFHS